MTDRPNTPEQAYTRSRRVRDAMKFIRGKFNEGQHAFEATQSRHVGPTYGVEPALIRRMKAKFRNELSFKGSDGK